MNSTLLVILTIFFPLFLTRIIHFFFRNKRKNLYGIPSIILMVWEPYCMTSEHFNSQQDSQLSPAERTALKQARETLKEHQKKLA